MGEYVHPAPQLLRTERLVLTDLVDDDFAAYYAIDLDPRVTPYVGDGQPETRTFEQYRNAERARFADGIGEHFHIWSIREQGGDDVLGRVMLRPLRGTEHVAVGYRLTPSRWGKGYATEALSAVLDYGFRNARLPEITATARIENLASHRVLERCGFTRDSILKHKGEDVFFFRLTKLDYEN
ncbi:MAG: N-acetyltransferase [Betaproteobacteria bacterium]|nr:MAG: N-acetyltransferase [Betaproteobacteria bacterium]